MESQMIYETIALGQAILAVYARDNSPEIAPERRYPAVQILPGYGYGICSDREAEPVALPFLAAGGHLAATLGCLWHETSQSDLARPAGMILCYPVISGGEYAHRGSFENLMGGDTALMEALLMEKRVDSRTASAFIGTTADDGAVPAMNSLLMAQALVAQGIPYSQHIFHQGVHGLSMADELTAPAGCTTMVNSQAARWFPLAVEWIRRF
jgi:acetyl esterase/lipase